MPRYVFTLRLVDESATLEGDALIAVIGRLGPLGKRRDDDESWVGEHKSSNEAQARREVEAVLAQLPRYVPKLWLVDLREHGR